MENDQLLALLEAVLLTSRAPLQSTSVAEALAVDGVDGPRIEGALELLASTCARPDRGVRLERVAGGWRIVTPPELGAHLRAVHGSQASQRLSQAALEVLAIVAHRQPVTLPEVNFIRGANSVAVVRTLLDRRLIRMAGRKQVVGKPFLYRTTRDFLMHFGLDRVEDLPDPETLLRDEGAVLTEGQG